MDREGRIYVGEINSFVSEGAWLNYIGRFMAFPPVEWLENPKTISIDHVVGAEEDAMELEDERLLLAIDPYVEFDPDRRVEDATADRMPECLSKPSGTPQDVSKDAIWVGGTFNRQVFVERIERGPRQADIVALRVSEPFWAHDGLHFDMPSHFDPTSDDPTSDFILLPPIGRPINSLEKPRLLVYRATSGPRIFIRADGRILMKREL